MTTRDPRSRPAAAPPARDSSREPTQSLHIEVDSALVEEELDDSSLSHPSLALGTHEKRERHTKAESPGAAIRGSGGANARRTAAPSRSPDDPDAYLGAQLGSYRVSALLGKGGMGYVYRAEHVKLGREVALKLLRLDYARRRDAVARFFQEARTVNRVRHRNIVDVTDFVELEDGTTYIIMELLQGMSLGKWARTGVDLPRALAVLVQICDGLGAAHAVGVIHRDLKPDNVIVVPTSDGAELVKLLDFGVAKLLNRDDEDVGFQTAAGSVIGTPAYMSPEQAGGMAIDHRSDIYSLGAIMYELFCGQPMFRGRSFGEYVRKHLTELPVRPRATTGGKELDERLEALILRCLEKEPTQRFGHIIELRDALLGLFGGELPSASYARPPSVVTGAPRALQLPLVAPPSQPGLVPSPLYRASSPSAHYSVQISPLPSLAQIPALQMPTQTQNVTAKSGWWLWVAGGAVAIALGIGGALWYAGRTSTELPAAHAPPPVAVVAPVVAPPPLVPKSVAVRFDSLPSASVFAEGHAAELCKTPCTVDVDLGDGGPTGVRAYVVRGEGYADKQVVVDLTAAHPEASVTLDRVAVATPTPNPILPTPPAPTQPARPARPTRPGHGHKPDPAVAVDPPPPPPPVLEPKPEPKKPPDETIDQSETMDPFRKK